MKTFPAILAALGITAVVAIGMLLIGANALFNPNAGPIFNSPTNVQAAAPASTTGTVSAVSASTSATSAQQIAQLQALVKQYQDREKQYQTELDQAAQKLNQANTQLSQANQSAQSYQNILMQLQQMGVIQISNDGQISVNRFGGGGRSGNNFFNGDD